MIGKNKKTLTTGQVFQLNPIYDWCQQIITMTNFNGKYIVT